MLVIIKYFTEIKFHKYKKVTISILKMAELNQHNINRMKHDVQCHGTCFESIRESKKYLSVF